MPFNLTELVGSAWESVTSSAPAEVIGRVGDTFLGGPNDINDNTLGQSEYDFTSRVFPSDLEKEDQAHYMVININVPVKDQSLRTGFSGTQSFQSLLPQEASKVDVLRFGNVQNFGGAQRGIFSVPRYTRRIKESIALYMPSPVVYTSMNQYEDISMTALAGNIGVAGAKVLGAVAGAVAGRGAPGSGLAGADAFGSLATATGQLVGTTAQLTGYPINPRVEVLFSTTLQRQFIFEFMLAPKNEIESKTIEEIITTLRYHAAPEIDPTFFGATFIPPAEFDITFYNKGVENTHLPRINTCVLERIDADYAPFEGKYVTFKNGYPVGVRLSLAFREVEIVHKLRVLQGF